MLKSKNMCFDFAASLKTPLFLTPIIAALTAFFQPLRYFPEIFSIFRYFPEFSSLKDIFRNFSEYFPTFSRISRPKNSLKWMNRIILNSNRTFILRGNSLEKMRTKVSDFLSKIFTRFRVFIGFYDHLFYNCMTFFWCFTLRFFQP